MQAFNIMMKILVVNDIHPVFMERMHGAGFRCDYRPGIGYTECRDIITGYDGLIVRTGIAVDRDLLEKARSLKFIGRAGAGMDHIDEEAAAEKGILLFNAPEGNLDAVGEHAIGMLLALLNKLREADTSVRNGCWDREGNRGLELKGKTVGIVGYGYMGQSLARKLAGFEVNTIAYDKYRSGFSDRFVREVPEPELFRQADVLSLHVPLTRETNGMVDESYWARFAKPVFLINTARGEIVDTAALLKAIARGRVLGACLDVLETEGFPALSGQDFYAALRLSDRVILSPHVAGWTRESYRKIAEVLAGKILQKLSAPRTRG